MTLSGVARAAFPVHGKPWSTHLSSVYYSWCYIFTFFRRSCWKCFLSARRRVPYDSRVFDWKSGVLEAKRTRGDWRPLSDKIMLLETYSHFASPVVFMLLVGGKEKAVLLGTVMRLEIGLGCVFRSHFLSNIQNKLLRCLILTKFCI